MKKLLLLLASGSIALTGVAQQRSVNFDLNRESALKVSYKDFKASVPKTANKTTAGPRWYDYNNYMDTFAFDVSSYGIELGSIPMYSDTVHKINYTTGGASHIIWMSYGSILDPSSVSFNNPSYYETAMKVGPTDAYTVTQVEVFGVYKGGTLTPAGTVDTIRLAFVTGLGGAASSDHIFGGSLVGGGHYGAATFVNMRHDSLLNRAKNGTDAIGTSTPTTYVQDIILDNSGTTPAWGDTQTNGIWHKVVTLTTPLSVPANGFAGMSMTFKSGESLTTNPAETIIHDYATGVTTHNTFWGLLGYVADAAGDEQWAPIYFSPDAKADSNIGLFKRLPGTNGWAGQYLPTVAWSSSTGGPSTLQFPYVRWNVTCATCGAVPPPPPTYVGNLANISEVNAYPNPAGNELVIPFTLNNASDVTVTLSNMLGQVVATRNMSNVTTGKAVFNTASLPVGIYTYSLNANGQKNTGRVVVSH